MGPNAATSLLEALRYAPKGVQQVEFTDWAQIKEQTGFADLTSGSPNEDRDLFLSNFIGRTDPPTPQREWATATLLQIIRFQEEHWRFDVLDLDWEAFIQARQDDQFVIAVVLRLRDGFDLDALIELLDERGYDAEVRGETTIRTHALTSEEWGLYPIQMHNVAILGDGRTLVLTTMPESLGPFVDAAADPSLAATDRAPLEAAATALGEPSSAIVIDGPMLCTSLDPANQPVPAPIQAEIDAATPLNLYTAWGMGYSSADDPIGRMVFVYGAPMLAAADLAGRQQLATSGHSIRYEGRTYAEMLTVDGAAADGGNLIFGLTPYADAPKYLFEGIYRRDMTYAVCAS
jgi:hypothetical protein